MERHPTADLDRKAGVLDRRAEALFTDAFLVLLVVFGLGYLGSSLLGVRGGGMVGGLITAQFAAFPALLLYQTALEGYYGATIGKYLRNIVVVKSDGSDVTWGSAVVRNVLRIVDALPVFYLLGIVVAYVTDEHQRIGDLAGGTVVVYTSD
jgi:uncharacterized RDD family membrane protein YckC